MAGKPGSGLSDKEAAFLAAAQRELAAKKAGTPVEKPAAATVPSAPASATPRVSTPPNNPNTPTPPTTATAAPAATAPAPLAARSTAASIPSAAIAANVAVPVDAPAPEAATPPARGVLPEVAAQRLAALMAQEAEDNARRKKRMRIWTTYVPVGLLVVLIGWVLTMLANLIKRNTF